MIDGATECLHKDIELDIYGKFVCDDCGKVL